MAWGYNKRPKILPKCRVCVPREQPCDVYSSEGHERIYYCRVCRRAVSVLDRMKPHLQIVRAPTATEEPR